MDNNRLSEIEARAKAATEGPWDKYWWQALLRDLHNFAPDFICSNLDEGLNYPGLDGKDHKTGAFIAHARQDIPDLIAYIRELEALIEEESHTPEPALGPWS